MKNKSPENVNEPVISVPPELPGILLDWYDRHARVLPWRRDTEPYHIWVSEIMLQQTGTETVKKYFDRFLTEFPTIKALAAADDQKLLKLWEGLGYYSRVRNMKRAAELLMRDGGRFPESYDALVKLPGIGMYTAGAIASICFEEPVPAVDGNVIRIITRITGYGDADKKDAAKHITRALKDLYPASRRGDFTQSLMELGALLCVPNGAPKCSLCPAADFCRAKAEGTVQTLALKPPKQEKKLEEITVLLLTCDGSIALRRREKSGLLSGLWELPNVEGTLSDRDAVEQAAAWGAQPSAILRSAIRRHLFTHIRWEMTGYVIDCRARPQNFVWADRALIRDEFAIPTAFRKFLDI